MSYKLKNWPCKSLISALMQRFSILIDYSPYTCQIGTPSILINIMNYDCEVLINSYD